MGSNAHLSVDRDSRRDKNRRVNLHLAMIHAELGLAAGNAEAAIKFAKEALQADALHVGALELLAKAQWQAGQCDELLSTLRTLIELNPYEPGYHSLQAGAYQSMGLCGSAVESYMRAVDLGMPKSVEMDAMIEDLRRWQGGLVTSLLSTDPEIGRAHV